MAVRSLSFSSVLLVSLLACAAPLQAAEPSKAITAAVADDSRPAEHRDTDEGRKPAEVLAIAGIKPGDRVAELAVGGGYYSALLSRVVGEEGKVYAVDPGLIFEAYPDARKTWATYAETDPRDNVEYVVAERFDGLSFPEPLDAIFFVRYYHDTVWTGEDRPKMNRALFEALKPGGVLVVIDHHAVAGAGDEVTKSLHRIDEAVVRREIEAAGFELRSESDVLGNPDDPRTGSVFAPDLRNHTDRFLLVYEKPAGG